MRLFAAGALSALALVGAPAFAASSVVGTWSTVMDTPRGQRESTLTVTQNGTAYAVTLTPVRPAGGSGEGSGSGPGGGAGGGFAGPRESTISDVAVKGSTLTFKRSVTTPQGAFDTSYTLTVDGDSIKGTASSPRGDIPVTGKRSN
jgi:hypothetical protein